MNKVQGLLIECLNAAIRNKKIDISKVNSIDWNELLTEASEHKVEALVYSSLNKEILAKMDKDIVNKLKRNTLITGLTQSNHFKQVEEIVNVFNEQNIPIIVLKGIILRALYPKPDLRTMSDADILVHEKDLDKAKCIMVKLGYYEYHSSPSHAVFTHSNHLPVEVHWTLADDHFFENIELFENEVWKNLEEVSIGNSKALSLGLEDMMLNQCIHMAKHLVYKGFGVRHLSDLVLLVEQKGDLMNWSRFRQRSNEYGIEKFTISIFMICNRLFDMKVPSELYDDKLAKGKYLDILIEDIFSSGVHGKNDVANLVANELAYTSGKIEGKSSSIMKRFMLKIFPRIEDMSDKYDYAKNYCILAPIAWIHHLLAGAFNKEYSLSDKMRISFGSISISKKKSDLLNWLEL